MSRPAILAVVAGALTFGWALGGMTSVDRDLAAAVSTIPKQTTTQFASDHPRCDHGGRHRADRHEL